MTKANMQAIVNGDELKQIWRLQWISCIFEFSSSNLQYMAWVKGPNTSWPKGKIICSSFEECFCSYFDDLALDDSYKKAVERNLVSQVEAENAEIFHQLASAYQEPSNDPEVILKDLEWKKVVNTAKKLWNYLKVTTTSKKEIELIKQLENDFC